MAGFLLRVCVFNNIAYRNVFIRQAIISENLADLVNGRDAVRDHIFLLTVSTTHQSVTLLISETSYIVFVFKPHNKFWQNIKCGIFISSLCLSPMEVIQVRLSYPSSAPAHASLPEKQGVSQKKSNDIELTNTYEP